MPGASGKGRLSGRGVFCGLPVDQTGLRMDRAEFYGGIFDPGREQMDGGKAHGFAVYVDGGQGGSYHPGF